jgi:hypothetical protein
LILIEKSIFAYHCCAARFSFLDLGNSLGERSCSPVWPSPHPGLVFFLQQFVSLGFIFHLLFLLRSRLAPDFLAQQISSPTVFLSQSHFPAVGHDPFSSAWSLPIGPSVPLRFAATISVSAEARADPAPSPCSVPDLGSHAPASWNCRLISLSAKIPARDSVLGVARPCCLFLLPSARSGAVPIFVSV